MQAAKLFGPLALANISLEYLHGYSFHLDQASLHFIHRPCPALMAETPVQPTRSATAMSTLLTIATPQTPTPTEDKSGSPPSDYPSTVATQPSYPAWATASAIASPKLPIVPKLSEYNFYCPHVWSSRDLVVSNIPKNTLHYAETHQWSRKPDILLHQSSDKSGPVVGTAFITSGIIRPSRYIDLALRDGAGESERISMRRDHILGESYTVEIPTSSCGFNREYAWIKTRSKDYNANWWRSLVSPSYKVLDVMMGEVVAVYTPNSGDFSRKDDVLRMDKDVGAHTEMFLLLAALSLCVIRTRRQRNYHGGVYAMA